MQDYQYLYERYFKLNSTFQCLLRNVCYQQ